MTSPDDLDAAVALVLLHDDGATDDPVADALRRLGPADAALVWSVLTGEPSSSATFLYARAYLKRWQ